MTSKRVYCGDCEKSWVRKVDYEKHFELENIKQKDGGKLIKNPCYKRKRRTVGYSLNEARANKKQRTLFCTTATTVEEPAATVSVLAAQPNEEDTVPADIITEFQQNSTQSSDSVAQHIDSDPQLTELNLASLDGNSSTNLIKTITAVTEASSSVILDKLDSVLTGVKILSNKIDTARELNSVRHPTMPRESSECVSVPQRDQYEKLVDAIRCSSWTSMELVMNNQLIKGVFEIEQADDQESEKLVCKACKKWAKGPATKLGFDLVGGSTYSIWASGVKKNNGKMVFQHEAKVGSTSYDRCPP